MMSESKIPDLPPKATQKSDRLNFREPGNASAKDRVKILKTKIEALVKEEEGLKLELDDLQKKYTRLSEVEKAERSQLQLKALQQEGMSTELRKLCTQVGKQFQDTKQALDQALIPRSVMIESSTRLRNTEYLAKATKSFEETQQKVNMEKLRQVVLASEIKKLKIKLDQLKPVLKGLEPELDGLKTLQENLKHLSKKDGKGEIDESQGQTNDHKKDKPEGSSSKKISAKETSTEENAVLQDAEENMDREVNGEGIRQTGDQSVRNGLKNNEGDQFRDGDDWDSPGEKNQSKEGEDLENQQNGREETKKGELLELMSNLVEEKKLSKKKKKENELEKLKEMEELLREHEGRRQRERQKIENQIETFEKEKKTKEEEEKKSKDSTEKLEEQMETAKLEFEDKKDELKNEHFTDTHERQENEEKYQKQKLEELERDISRQDVLNKVRGLHTNLIAPIEIPIVTTGKKLQPIDSLRRTVRTDAEKSHLDTIRKIIDEFESLEMLVKDVQRKKAKVGNLANLRKALERERDLEHQWSNYVDNPTKSKLAKDSRTGHLSTHETLKKLKIYDDDSTLSPLPVGKLRLLILWPAPEAYYPLLCTLETHKLEDNVKDNPSYAALSYYWGPNACSGTLYLVQHRHEEDSWGYGAEHAMRIPIRNNLFRALLRLRSDHHPVALWVDAVCIDQQNEDEKTIQLGEMAKVYKNAENVCVWLGESDAKESSDKAMQFIKDLADFAVLEGYTKDKKQAGQWLALSRLMKDRWFSRRWVVQEISFALGKATVHCGDKVVHWSEFSEAVSLLVSNQEAIKKLFDYSDWRDGPKTLGNVRTFGAHVLLEATSNLFLTNETGRETKSTKSLESLVTSLKTFDASDQRDLIYSLVYIAKDAERGPSKRLDPDYKKKSTDVYKDFTRFCIRSSRLLDVICRPWAMPILEDHPLEKNKKITIELPSWIPLLSKSEFGVPEEAYRGRKNGDNLVGPAVKPHYRASGKTRYFTGPGEDSGKDPEPEPFRKEYLLVKGFTLAKVTNISARNTGGVILRESLRMGWNKFQENSEMPDKIWRTLVADRDPDGQPPPAWYRQACSRCLEIADNFNNGDLNVGELMQEQSEMLHKYLARVRDVTWNRRFFTAETIKYPKNEQEYSEKKKQGYPEKQELFGLGPPRIEKDDIVCILFGCSVPVILRKVEDGNDGNDIMELIGEGYVYGKMEGEAVDDYIDMEEDIQRGKDIYYKETIFCLK